MKYTIVINQKLCIEQEISFKAAALLDLFSELSTWATAENFEDGVYYKIAYSKIIADLPIVFAKRDTLYRFIKELKNKGLIEQRKKGANQENFMRLSVKGKSVFRVGNKSEPLRGSEINPKRVGNKSEPLKPSQSLAIVRNVKRGSDLNPTYYNTTINNNIYISFLAYQFLQKNAKEQIEIWEMQNKKFIEDYDKFLEYFEACVQAEEIEYTANKLMGRLKKLKFNWNPNKSKQSSFDNQPIKKAKRIG